MTRRVLVLGGTAEARVLAGLLDGDPGLAVTTSLAGRTPQPGPLAGQVRTGGFGGAAGLAGWLRDQRADAVVDATHPFAAAISAHAAQAALATGVPLLALRRPGWSAGVGDRWHWADSLAEAAALLPALGQRPFLTTGRQDLAAFAGLPLDFLARSVTPPDPPLPARLRVLLDRGPFTLDAERALLREHRVDVLVTKDSGGQDTAAKLTAAREAALPVLIVRRPPPAPAPGVSTVTTPAAAVRWLRALR
ncbi:cobalt-precorrin-6A reductase [Streptomyces sp. NBC_01198]|uniref:cobalt-precorrin-6A reductase n=1 Tax=Streptomyces sp. NBC_01198 TaxID=2903769 RepID=UPI002E11967A|nr:cobalt-precorrin-6A reductase [Streptomyces sp. NBC_01198]